MVLNTLPYAMKYSQCNIIIDSFTQLNKTIGFIYQS